MLELNQTDQSTATQALDNGDVSGVLTLPSGLAQQLLDGLNVAVELQTDPNQPSGAEVVEQTVRAALNQVASSISIADTSLRVAEDMRLFDISGAPSRQALYQAAQQDAAQAWTGGPPLTVETTPLTRRAGTQVSIPLGFQQTSPGIGVMFAMFFVTFGGASILLEREQGTLRRLLTMPVTKFQILAGKVLGVFVAGVIQFAILVLAGQFLFGVDWGEQPLALSVMILAFVFCTTSFSILIASVVRTYAQVDAMATLIILPLSALGGAMWPIEIVPQWMQRVALFTPTGWAMQGFHDIITRGLGLQDILLEAGVLLAFGAAFLAIGVWRFKFE